MTGTKYDEDEEMKENDEEEEVDDDDDDVVVGRVTNKTQKSNLRKVREGL